MVLIKENDKEKVQIQDQIQAKPIEEVLDTIPNPSDEVLFQIKQCSNGMGMFALQDIFPGQIILREKPILVMPDKVFSSDDQDYIEAWLDKRLNEMSCPDRQAFYDLSDCRSVEKTTLGIFFTNDMNFVDESAALFPIMARVNHACRPNADFITRKFLGVQDLVATKFIAQGNIFLSIFFFKKEKFVEVCFLQFDDFFWHKVQNPNFTNFENNFFFFFAKSQKIFVKVCLHFI